MTDVLIDLYFQKLFSSQPQVDPLLIYMYIENLELFDMHCVQTHRRLLHHV